jgi:hypothetical protein
VRNVWGQQEHLAFANREVPEFAFINDFEEHGAAVLVEPFCRFIDVIVCSGIWAADNLLPVSIWLPIQGDSGAVLPLRSHLYRTHNNY